MRILQIMAGARHGGAETAFVDMCIALHECGEVVEVVTRANDVRIPRLEAAGLVVHELPFGGALDVFTPWRMAKIIRAFKPDIVQTWMSRAAMKAPAWKESMNIPRYLVVARLGGYYKIKYFKSADYFVALTPDLKKHLVFHGAPEDKINTINNFAEIEMDAVPVLRMDMETPEDAPVLLALGRLHTSKAFDTLIKAVAPMPGVYLWIAGEGPERQNLEKMISDLGVGDRVKLLGWRSDRAALFQASDVCVFSSRHEPFGTVFVQAWAQKIPLITTNSQGPGQFVRDGEDGIITPIDDVVAMTASIDRVLRDDDLRGALVANWYRRYETEFTKAKIVQAYLAWYHEIRAKEGLSP
jgi:glycosyltransferase involved in cell wall biosynthesis